MSHAAAERRLLLIEALPGHLVRDVVAIAAAVALTALAAQVAIPTPWGVPFTGQTFAVLLAGGALGAARGAIALGLYLVLGLWLPIYSGAESGWTILSGTSGGYIFGFVAAAAVVGFLARRGWDRRPATMAASFAIGSAIVYAFGVPWLAHAFPMSMGDAAYHGMVVFLAGDALKAVLAGVALPGAWRLLGERD